jgi:hypothetical protein
MDQKNNNIVYGVGWKMEISGTTLVSFEGNEHTLKIPEGIEKIAMNAFLKGEVVEVILSSSVKEIESFAFSKSTGLQKIDVPDYVHVGEKAFAECKKLADKNGFIIFRNVLQGYCRKSEKACIPEGVVRIAESAFADNQKLQYVEFPSTLESIGHAAFYGCTALKEVTIPEKVKHIGGAAFRCCKNLAKVSLPKGPIDTGGNVFDENGCLVKDKMVIIDGRLFVADYEARELALPSDVRSIENYACNLPYLKMAIVPEGVTRIGDYAFGSCRYLREITLPETLQEMGEDVFCDYRAVKKPLVIRVKKNSFAHSYALSLSNVSVIAT